METYSGLIMSSGCQTGVKNTVVIRECKYIHGTETNFNEIDVTITVYYLQKNYLHIFKYSTSASKLKYERQNIANITNNYKSGS